ncbi:hypothetical protein [Methylobacterium aerolatum]|uniref:Secreted protein n=1 Tax=Methylobacterium aerolatum TaxID=418708 RepID=A0ABU0I5B5_9HYPH|nr:hypothetical protein [Methylobacterium aerolatum]MDQ0449277.1 hypothetical protein [Methylobacterium aerolatum]GJD35461.1 hypothetical protein FMGBMHLM_2371 [Methylobacterium aerolatum]
MLKQAILVFTLSAGVSAAAVAAPVDTTGTGGGPASTAKAPYTTSTGATVPRPGAIDRQEAENIQRPTKQDRIDNSITNGICIGCAPK